eukprot:c3870_g1_i2.p2 GENE.c3870_g1_i2~~c3870_g1_i2.p2  ORF type:complete len:110 (+),score=24.67 c3870_g1_i2:171-500(+)
MVGDEERDEGMQSPTLPSLVPAKLPPLLSAVSAQVKHFASMAIRPHTPTSPLTRTPYDLTHSDSDSEGDDDPRSNSPLKIAPLSLADQPPLVEIPDKVQFPKLHALSTM